MLRPRCPRAHRRMSPARSPATRPGCRLIRVAEDRAAGSPVPEARPAAARRVAASSAEEAGRLPAGAPVTGALAAGRERPELEGRLGRRVIQRTRREQSVNTVCRGSGSCAPWSGARGAERVRTPRRCRQVRCLTGAGSRFVIYTTRTEVWVSAASPGKEFTGVNSLHPPGSVGLAQRSFTNEHRRGETGHTRNADHATYFMHGGIGGMDPTAAGTGHYRYGLDHRRIGGT